MFTLVGVMIGFVAMLAARGRAGIAAGLALMGFVLALASSVVFGFEMVVSRVDDPESLLQVDWSLSNWIALIMGAAPGVLGALLARRD
ncbi:MAG: hypothetical protein AAGM38_03165 [Pseudomonadota bacterium]